MFYGLIFEGECVAVIKWTEVSQRLVSEVPQFHDFPLTSVEITDDWEIHPIKITW